MGCLLCHCGCGIAVSEVIRLLPKHPSPVKKKCRRQTFNTPKLLRDLVGRDRERIVDSDPFRKFQRVFSICHRIGLEPDNDETLSTIAINEFLVAGHLLFARAAPCCPKINDYHLAGIITTTSGVTVQIVDIDAPACF